MPDDIRALQKIKSAIEKRLERGETLRSIANNANVPYGWLQQVLYERIKEPGYFKLRDLAGYLGVEL